MVKLLGIWKKPLGISHLVLLFIANLGPTSTEAELKEVLSKYAGFHTLKMRGRGGMPVAFADFQDVESSTAVMNALQSTSLSLLIVICKIKNEEKLATPAKNFIQPTDHNA
ncbi:hypothetical protein HPP92_004883 [Vanilla planifolia]|uniref:RRM domain-containing protein n=1 Tax=Vanilla planifolia TaxID=51239 RepID=A0A835RR61_VANPL|nr:hypothetical protein HPP92_004883 [Vanilla planifolia]